MYHTLDKIKRLIARIMDPTQNHGWKHFTFFCFFAFLFFLSEKENLNSFFFFLKGCWNPDFQREEVSLVKMPEAQFKYDFYFSNEKKHTLEKFCTLVFTKNRLREIVTWKEILRHWREVPFREEGSAVKGVFSPILLTWHRMLSLLTCEKSDVDQGRERFLSFFFSNQNLKFNVSSRDDDLNRSSLSKWDSWWMIQIIIIRARE